MRVSEMIKLLTGLEVDTDDLKLLRKILKNTYQTQQTFQN